MDRQLIKALIDALDGSNLSELEYTRDGETLRLAKSAGPSISAPGSPPALQPSPAVPSPSPSPVPAASGRDVAAPLFGVVHLCPAPDAAPFVLAGQPVQAGQVLCTVEAMKVFTEVRAPAAGTVDAILVTDGQEVEPGQCLVRLA